MDSLNYCVYMNICMEHTEMSSEDEILALDGLIEAYIDHGSQDITAWLERRKRNIQSKNIKTVPAS